ncbi:hypothetical protein [Methylopila sp. M107]|uniref:hypothetical protein n=1 Tax=Methylopila sp. M107 TaxID=1101190 RepID=UPI00036F3DFE|nr:hypothetical protein [Methylopila sp. M107]
MRRAIPTLGAILAIGFLAPSPGLSQEPSSTEVDAKATDALALNPLAAFDKATLDAFRDAPLFTPSRTRPPPPPPPVVAEAPPPPPPAEAPPPEPPTLKLAGIVEGPDGAVAFVAKEGEETVEQLRLGDQVDGWLVSTIEPSALKLTLDEREQEYRLFARPEGAGLSGDDEDETDKNGEAEPFATPEPSEPSADDGAADADEAQPEKSGAQREQEAAKAQRDAERRRRRNAPNDD